MSADLRAAHGCPVIVGAGIAGLMTALHLAPEPVALVTKDALGCEASSAWAQGGLAASVGADDDPALHLADTLAAGDGLVDVAIARRLTAAAPALIDDLARLGVRFDRTPDGALALGLEAAHSRHRIVHAAGDGAGRELMRALIAAVRRTPSITVWEGVEARRLLTDQGAVTGILLARGNEPEIVRTGRVIFATGGIGGLFSETTNPDGCCGQGLALAARAGAALADLEFIQFHPTALVSTARPAPLISEAVRGEGAILIDETGDRFLANEPGAELAPRDVVARSVWRRLDKGHTVFLDASRSLGPRFAERFPIIAAACNAAGLDPARHPIPIRPAVHYHMGGIAVDEHGCSSLPGLWACGEVACTGLHGANRLASNSLIEAAICAGWVAASVTGFAARPHGPTREAALPPPSDPSAVRAVLSRGVGVLRDGDGLRAAIAALQTLVERDGPAADPALTGLMIAVAALRRQESRGAHWRIDFPSPAAVAQRSMIRLADAMVEARALNTNLAPIAKRA